MKPSPTAKSRFVYCISLLHVFLFVYAATGKLSDFQGFRVQLGQSPLLSAFAGTVAWAVPVVEIAISLLLVLPAYRRLGLYLAFCLMAMFTAYIFIILNYASFVPCSCGGILEKLGWTEHLFFNTGFLLLAALGLEFSRAGARKSLLGSLLVCLASSAAIVAVLYILSEDTMKYRNNFVRRFMHHPAAKAKDLDLGLDGYYIAGSHAGKIYLGHLSAPLHLLETDTNFSYQKRHTIKLSRKDFAFRSMAISVSPPNFYFMDGTVPVIFKGDTIHWQGRPIPVGKQRFLKSQPCPDGKIAIRILSPKLGRNVLGTIDTVGHTVLSPGVLTAQEDGMFDTDGAMAYNRQKKVLLYTYFYRNQYVVAEAPSMAVTRGNTIDTFSLAQVKSVRLRSDGSNKMAEPPLVVNKAIATYGRYLFVHSGIPGRYERERMWKRAAVVDVYDFLQKSYVFSFYIQNEMDGKLSEFAVDGRTCIAIVGRKLVAYRLQTNVYEPLK